MISFKPLSAIDFEILKKWMNLDFVSRWYDMRKFIYNDVEKKYFSSIAIKKPVDSYIIQIEDESIGYVHTYRIYDYPQIAKCFDVDVDAYGIDMFIGNSDFIYKGYGKFILEQFVKSFIFNKSNSTMCVAGLEDTNSAAIRIYEKAGFSFLKKVSCTDGHQEQLMVLRKKVETMIYQSKTV